MTYRSNTSNLQCTTTAIIHLYVSVDTVCRDELDVLDANSDNFILRPTTLPRSIMLNSDDASPTVVDTQATVALVFNRTTSLKTRFMQVSMWASNVARVTVELRRFDDPRYEPALRVSRHVCCSSH